MLTQIILHIYHSNGHSETGNIHLMVQMDVCAHVHQREREMDRKMHRQMIMGSRIKFISHPQQPQSFINFTDAEKSTNISSRPFTLMRQTRTHDEIRSLFEWDEP